MAQGLIASFYRLESIPLQLTTSTQIIMILSLIHGEQS